MGSGSCPVGFHHELSRCHPHLTPCELPGGRRSERFSELQHLVASQGHMHTHTPPPH